MSETSPQPASGEAAHTQETSRGLPVVTKATVEGLFQSANTSERAWGQRLEEVRHRLLQEQPELARFLESQVGKFPPQLHAALFEIAVGTYSLLEQQAHVNRINFSYRAPGEGKEET